MQFLDQLWTGSLFEPSMSVSSMLMYLLLAFLLGQLLAWVYMWTHEGLSYSRSQVHSLILLSLIVTAVMLAVGNNLARAFGLFGALALVRFRTPVKDSRDTAFLFMAVGIGISVGTENLGLAVVGTVFMCIVAVYLSKTRFGTKIDHDAILRLTMPAGPDQESKLRGILTAYCRRFALVHLRDLGHDESMEFAYQVHLITPESSSSLVSEIRAIPGLGSVDLLLQNEDIEV